MNVNRILFYRECTVLFLVKLERKHSSIVFLKCTISFSIILLSFCRSRTAEIQGHVDKWFAAGKELDSEISSKKARTEALGQEIKELEQKAALLKVSDLVSVDHG